MDYFDNNTTESFNYDEEDDAINSYLITEKNIEEENPNSLEVTNENCKQPSFKQGFGGCHKCSCKEFEGLGDICENCYHHYDDHR